MERQGTLAFGIVASESLYTGTAALAIFFDEREVFFEPRGARQSADRLVTLQGAQRVGMWMLSSLIALEHFK